MVNKKTISLVVVLLVLVVGCVVLYSTNQQNDNSPTGVISKEEFEKQTDVGRNDNAQASALSAVVSGNDETAATVYDNAIAAEKDPLKKVELAADHSRILFADGQQSAAIEVLEAAVDYNSDKFRVYDLLGHAYEKAKRYLEAAAYYEKASLLVNSPTNIGQYSKTYYDNRVDKLKALAG